MDLPLREAWHLRASHQSFLRLIELQINGSQQRRLGPEKILKLTPSQKQPLLQEFEGLGGNEVKELLDVLRERLEFP